MPRIGGIANLTVNGVRYPVKPGWTFNAGRPLRTSIAGDDNEVHGFTETGQVPYLEGPITKNNKVKLAPLLDLVGATVVATAGDGTVYTLREAHFAAEGDFTTDEGEIAARFEGEVMDIDE